MIGFSGVVMAGCIVYSFFDKEPFLDNPRFGDILGAGAAVVLSSLVLLLLNNEHRFSGLTWRFAEIMDSLTLIWLPAAFGLWALIAWHWNRTHGIHKPSLLKKILKGILSFV
jgi:hypothetical protein